MVAPNEEVLDLVRVNTGSVRDHTDSSVLIESSHGTEVLSWDRWCILGANQGISVSRISYHTNFDGLLCNLIDSLTLSLENLGICLKTAIEDFHRMPTKKDTGLSKMAICN